MSNEEKERGANEAYLKIDIFGEIPREVGVVLVEDLMLVERKRSADIEVSGEK